MSEIVKIAALSDPHFGRHRPFPTNEHKRQAYVNLIQQINNDADILLVAGDWTDSGLPEEAEEAAIAFAGATIPVIGIEGNHDYNPQSQTTIPNTLESKGTIKMLQGGGQEIFRKNGSRLNIVGVTGYTHDYGHKVMGKNKGITKKKYEEFIKADFGRLAASLSNLPDTTNGDINVVLLHFPLVHKPNNRYEGAGKPDDEEPESEYDLRHLIAKNKNKIDFVFHGHIHSDGNSSMTWEDVDVRNVAATPLLVDIFNPQDDPQSVIMAPGVQYRIVPLSPKRIN